MKTAIELVAEAIHDSKGPLPAWHETPYQYQADTRRAALAAITAYKAAMVEWAAQRVWT